MTTTTMAFGLGFIVVLICVLDAFIWHRKGSQTLYRFFLMDGKLRLPGFIGTIVAANLSLGNFIVFICTWGYTFGFAGIVFFVCNLFLNVLGFVLFLPAFRSYIEDRSNNGTIHDYLSRAYGGDPHSTTAARIRFSASLVTVVCLSLAMVFELSLAVELLHPANLTQTIYLFGCLAGLIAFFTAYGGFRTLIASDIANAGILALGLICLIFFVFKFSMAANTAPMHVSLTVQDIKNLGWPNIVSILLIGSGWMLVAMDQWQRTCASRSFRVTFRGMIVYFFILSLFAVTFATWGAFDHSILPNLLSGQASKSLAGSTNPLMDIAALPVIGDGKFVVMFILSGLVFAAVSTTNTFLNVCSHSLTTDVLVGSFSHKEMGELSEKQNRLYVGIGRAVIIAISSTLVVAFALLTESGLLKDPLSFFFITYSVQFALLAPMILSILPMRFRPTPSTALASIYIGFAVALIVGFGSWLLGRPGGPASIFGLAPSDWGTLTPVVTVLVGFVPLLTGIGRR